MPETPHALEIADPALLAAAEAAREWHDCIPRDDRLVVVVNVDGHVVFGNDALIEHLGQARGDVLGRNWFRSFVAGEDHGAIETLFHAYVAAGQIPRHWASATRGRDGGIRAVRWTNTTLRDDQARIIGVVSVGIDITEQTAIDSTLEFIARQSWKRSDGHEFLRALVQHVGEATGLDLVFVGELCGRHRERIQTIAMWDREGGVADLGYELHGTPCEKVFECGLCSFTDSVADLFPDDVALRSVGAASYVGILLRDVHGVPIGIASLIGRQPLTDPWLVESLLQIVAIRVAAEVERHRADEVVRTNQARYRAFVETSPAGFWWYEIDPPVDVHQPQDEQITQILERAVLVECNEMYAKCVGFNTADEVLGRRANEILGADETAARALVRSWVQAGHRFDFVEMEQHLRSGEYRRFHFVGEGVIEDGLLVRGWGTQLDLTHLREMESDLRQTKYSIDHSGGMMCWVTADGAFKYANRAVLCEHGYDSEDSGHLRVWDLDTEVTEETWPQVYAGLAKQRSATFETVNRMKDGSTFPVEVNVSHGRFEGEEYLFAFLQNISGRKEAEAQLVTQASAERRLLTELDHRVRNNLAALMSLIDLSRQTAQSVDELADTMQARTQAIAAVHAALASSKWQSISLRGLVRQLIQIGHEPAIKVHGPEVLVPPGQAQALGIVLNEMVTNSVKYGAMTSSEGRVDVAWSTRVTEAGVELELRWHETGVAIELPSRRGSGLDLIEGLVRSELRGDVTFNWPRSGADHVISVLLHDAATAQFGPA